MDSPKTIKVVIKKDGSGEISFDLDGFIGNSCDELEQIENAMGHCKREDTHERLYEQPDPAFINVGK